MLKKIVLILIFLINMNLNCKFVLLTALYNETNEQRAQEYKACIEYNLNNSYIDEIFVLYDTTKDNNQNKLLNFLKTKKINIVFKNSRQTYKDLFDIAKNKYPNQKIIVANADIYFDSTLSLLENYSFENKLLVLTRRDVLSDGTSKLIEYYDQNTKKNEIMNYANDTWIFQSPIKEFECNFPIGVLNCDILLNFNAQNANVNVLNPCLSINCFHLHLSAIRDYSHNIQLSWPSGVKFAAPSTL